MIDSEAMAFEFAENILPSKDKDNITNAHIYAIHSVAGALTWGDANEKKISPVLAEFYLCLFRNCKNPDEMSQKFAPQLLNTYKDIEHNKSTAQLFIDTAKAIDISLNETAKFWLNQCEEKFNMTAGLLEVKHMHSVFRGNQYVFDAYAFYEFVTAIDDIELGWNTLQKAIDLS